MIATTERKRKEKSNRHVEVVTSGSKVLIENAIRRLLDSNRKQKVIQVPDQDFQEASRLMREVGVSGTVKNMSGTRRRYVNRQEIERTRKSKEIKAGQHFFRPYMDIWSIQL